MHPARGVRCMAEFPSWNAETGEWKRIWREGHRAVRAELRGCYPRHPWPQDPAAAEPARRLNTPNRGAP
ncbi:ATP-dependent helicase C-terminal domain-containing protein, partial [Streptomyces sp. G1]|uniref:ATP-dependent helicase C-terminal domain-containing protein n=1 Tax=Streptomyces sp. G1 TaxID=361572 RepID=UPI0027E5491F